jgi:putative glutamine amidotransferase
VNRTQPLVGISVYRTKTHWPPHTCYYGLHPFYIESVLAGGGAPVQIPLGLDQAALRTVFDRVDALILSGGGDVDPALYDEPVNGSRGIDRERDEIELALIRWALQEAKPLLAICRGIQVLNVALGGSLYQDIASDVPGAMRHDYFDSQGFARDHLAHEVDLTPGCRLARLLGVDRVPVNSLHHQGLKTLAADLVAVGHAPDGLVEAVEITGHPFAVGVQWHPEALAPNDPVMRRLFEGLVVATRYSDE